MSDKIRQHSDFPVDSEAWLQEWARDKFTYAGSYRPRVLGQLYGNTDWALARALHSAIVAAVMPAAAQSAPAAPVAQEPVALEQRATEAHALLRRVYDSGFDDDCVDAVGDWLNEHHTSPAAEQPDTLAVPRELLSEALAWLEVNDAGYPTKELRALLAGGAA